jgi:hypothetical protein
VYPVIDASSWEVESVEPGGQDPGTWVVDEVGTKWLFKPAVVRGDRRQGEDWAEKIAAELAQLIRLPAAIVEIAVRNSAAGCLSRDLKPGDGWQMHTGAVLISEVDPRLTVRSKDRLGHNLDNIARVLGSVAAPLGWRSLPSKLAAFDVFCGFLMFDAWIANLDRHEENWSVLQAPDGSRHLAPSYDHGNSLGFNLLDSKRARIMRGSPPLSQWAAKATAGRFENGKTVSLVDHTANALTMAQEGTGQFWRDRIGSVASRDLEAIVAAVPEMSQHARTFLLRLLDINRERLLT